MSRAEYDVDVIRERLTVATVLRAGGISDIDESTRRTRCPMCDAAELSFSIYSAGRRYSCHRFSCGESGDAIDLIRWIFDENFPNAIARAAGLVQVSKAPIDANTHARRAAERAGRRMVELEAQRVRVSEATSISTDCWGSLISDQWNGTRWLHLREYLRVRRVDGVLQLCNGFPAHRNIYVPADMRLAHVLLPSETGELALAILDDAEAQNKGDWIAASGHLIVGVSFRGVARTVEEEHDFPVDGPIVAWSDRTPKVRCITGGSTRGTFGAPRSIIRGGRCVLVEGMMDFVAAHLAYRDEHTAILGAHAAGRMEHAGAVACRRLGPGGNLVVVSHSDDAGRAAEARVNAVAAACNVHVTRHDLGAHKDLADQVAAW
jgi:hypothetical protein